MVDKQPTENQPSSESSNHETTLSELIDLGKWRIGMNEKEIIQKALSSAVQINK